MDTNVRDLLSLYLNKSIITSYKTDSNQCDECLERLIADLDNNKILVDQLISNPLKVLAEYDIQVSEYLSQVNAAGQQSSSRLSSPNANSAVVEGKDIASSVEELNSNPQVITSITNGFDSEINPLLNKVGQLGTSGNYAQVSKDLTNLETGLENADAKIGYQQGLKSVESSLSIAEKDLNNIGYTDTADFLGIINKQAQSISTDFSNATDQFALGNYAQEKSDFDDGMYSSMHVAEFGLLNDANTSHSSVEDNSDQNTSGDSDLQKIQLFSGITMFIPGLQVISIGAMIGAGALENAVDNQQGSSISNFNVDSVSDITGNNTNSTADSLFNSYAKATFTWTGDNSNDNSVSFKTLAQYFQSGSGSNEKIMGQAIADGVDRSYSQLGIGGAQTSGLNEDFNIQTTSEIQENQVKFLALDGLLQDMGNMAINNDIQAQSSDNLSSGGVSLTKVWNDSADLLLHSSNFSAAKSDLSDLMNNINNDMLDNSINSTNAVSAINNTIKDETTIIDAKIGSEITNYTNSENNIQSIRHSNTSGGFWDHLGGDIAGFWNTHFSYSSMEQISNDQTAETNDAGEELNNNIGLGEVNDIGKLFSALTQKVDIVSQSTITQDVHSAGNYVSGLNDITNILSVDDEDAHAGLLSTAQSQLAVMQTDFTQQRTELHNELLILVSNAQTNNLPNRIVEQDFKKDINTLFSNLSNDATTFSQSDTQSGYDYASDYMQGLIQQLGQDQTISNKNNLNFSFSKLQSIINSTSN
ncbi:hypothetical protein [Cysteiniphilum halobium]|uniref:hypothetical protein n=1 Tax=Cysteiniphilum halobium TaxID=2219059 RepID=UPI003F8529BC